MAERAVILGDLTNPHEVQKLREYLIELYGFAGLRHQFSSVRTTDATVTTLVALPLEDNSSYHLTVSVVGRRTGGSSGAAGDSASYVRVGTFYRVSAGGATQVGSTSTPHTAESQSGWECALSTSGNDVLVRVTGASGNNLSWSGLITLQKV